MGRSSKPFGTSQPARSTCFAAFEIATTAILAGAPGVDDEMMFGGIAFLKEGKIFCGIVKDDLMVR
jgi:hypothetical protein